MSDNEEFDEKMKEQGYSEEPRNCCDNCTHLIMKYIQLTDRKMVYYCSIGDFPVKRKKGRCTLHTNVVQN